MQSDTLLHETNGNRDRQHASLRHGLTRRRWSPGFLWAHCSPVRDGSICDLLVRQAWLRGPVLRASGACDGCGMIEVVPVFGGTADVGTEGRVAQCDDRQGRRCRGRKARGLEVSPVAGLPPLRPHADCPKRHCERRATLQAPGLPSHLQRAEQVPVGPVGFEGQLDASGRCDGSQPDQSYGSSKIGCGAFAGLALAASLPATDRAGRGASAHRRGRARQDLMPALRLGPVPGPDASQVRVTGTAPMPRLRPDFPLGCLRQFRCNSLQSAAAGLQGLRQQSFHAARQRGLRAPYRWLDGEGGHRQGDGRARSHEPDCRQLRSRALACRERQLASLQAEGLDGSLQSCGYALPRKLPWPVQGQPRSKPEPALAETGLGARWVRASLSDELRAQFGRWHSRRSWTVCAHQTCLPHGVKAFTS